MKLVFFGSSEFSIPILKALAASDHQIDLVVTTPPQKKGRGQKVEKSLVQTWALENSLSCVAPSDIKNTDFKKTLQALQPECYVIASYGKILPASVLEIPTRFPLNIHPSLLPNYRGAAPIAWQLLNDEKESGITIATITEKLDAGEIIIQEKISIDENDHALSLGEKLANLGSELILVVLDLIAHNQVQLVPQDESKSSYAKKLSKKMGEINWNESARQIHNQIRAFLPWPSAYTFWKGKRIKILRSKLAQGTGVDKTPGTILEIDSNGFMRVQAKPGVIKIELLQPESGKMMDAYSFALGHQIKTGERFS